MRTVFVPTDFSDASLIALKYAVEIAQTAGADLVLYSAVHLPPPVAELGAVAAPPPADELLDDTRKALLGLAKELEAHTTRRIDVVVELGLASDCIEDWMDEHRPWLTVMASKGTTGLERMVWGSVTRHVAEHAPTPVLVLPETQAYEPIESVLYATDFQSGDAAVTRYLMDWTEDPTGLKVHFVHVADGAVPMEYEEAHLAQFEADLGQIAPAPQLTFDLKPGRRVADALATEIASGDWNLVVVCPQQRSWFVRLFAPSVSNQLVEQLDLPLLVHPGNRSSNAH